MKELSAALLTKGQIFGSDQENQLPILEEYGLVAAITDFAILLGGYVSDRNFCPDGTELRHRSGIYWTASADGGGDVCIVHKNGLPHWERPYVRRPSLRPVISMAVLPQEASSAFRTSAHGIQEVDYGEYPQTAASPNLQQLLEKLWKDHKLSETENAYTTDSQLHDDYRSGFCRNVHREYEYQGHYYVRVIANSDFGQHTFVLSNGKKYFNGDPVWVEVQPITWLVDHSIELLVSKYALVSGIRFHTAGFYDGEFEITEMQAYLKKHFSRDMLPRRRTTENTMHNKEESRKKNPYGFIFEKVAEEDIIRGAVQSGISVFVHGQSSEGKSARIRQLDPDCVVLYLRNTTPDSLNGKSVYDASTGTMIDVPPTWFSKVSQKCETEPDKIHIVFFDEITNALHSIQGMAFNIILDREVNGRWKLPDNCRVVAAGNDLNDSIAANALAEPLFNRFAHVYIKTTVQDWLAWALTEDRDFKQLTYCDVVPKHRIHPAVYAFISYRGEKALRSEYTGEKPNADPRKWEIASKLLYIAKNPYMLRSLVGDKITNDFVHFCNQQALTAEDVIAGRYTEEDLNMSKAEKYALAVALSEVSAKDFPQAKEFIAKFGSEYLAVFEALWMREKNTRKQIV